MNLSPSSTTGSTNQQTTSGNQSSNQIQLGVGVGLASFSSSNTPFSSNINMQRQTTNTNNNNNNTRPITIPTCSLHHQNRHHQTNNNIDLYDSSSSSSPPSSSTFFTQCTNNTTTFNTFHNPSNQNALTLTLITTTPLIPIVQPFANHTPLTQTSVPSSSTTSTSNSSPSTSAVSSSSCSSTCSTVSSSASSICRDWFTYEYKLDHIEDLIKSHETQQSFVQSPVFSFTNHIITQASSSNSTNDSQKHAQASNWRLIFYPNGAGADCKNFLSIFLKYMSDEPVKIQMMFSIVDNNNDDVYVKYTVNKFQKSNDWGFKQLIHKNAILFQKEKFLKSNKSLMVRVKMRLDEHKHDYIKKLNDNLHYCKLLSENFSQYYYNQTNQVSNLQAENTNSSTSPVELQPTSSAQPSSSSSSSSSSSTSNSSLSSLTNNNNTNKSLFSNLTQNSSPTNSSYFDILLLVKSSSADCVCATSSRLKRNLTESECCSPAKRARTLEQCGKCEFAEFRAHKCILAARSPVFKAMFNYKLKENLTNKLVIEDSRPEVVKAMLKYIYTAYLPDDIKHIALDLYIAAEKYFIESLKIKCREFLVENLGLETCIQIYILSELYNDSMLRKQSLKYINENIDKVTQNADWNEFMSVYPQFFTNAFIRICKKDF